MGASAAAGSVAGRLAVGGTYRRAFTLTNAGHVLKRFRLPDAASLDEIRGLAEYEGRRLACARVGMVEMQLSHLSAEREEARQRAAEMERAVDESEVAQAQLRSRYSRL